MKINKITKTKGFNILLLFLATLIISFPFIIDSSILKTNDMSGNVVNLVYIKKTIAEHRVFPQWNPYLNQGLPIVADPLNSFFNPIILFSFLIFPLSISIKLTYFISIFLSGLFFYFLLRYLNIEKKISLLSAFTFMSSGYLAARIYAGHLEKILSYPLGPLLLLSLLILLKRGGLKWAGVVALTLSLFVFSGAIYEALYAFIVFGLIFLLSIATLILKPDKKSIEKVISLIIAFILFLLFSAIKILPLVEISPYILHVSDPFKGSQTFISLIYNLFFPYKELYSLFGINNFNPNIPYFWWESYAFIGFLPFLCIILIPFFLYKRLTTEFKIFIYLSISIILFSMIGNPWNPFTWLFNHVSFLQQFRIPSRIFLFLIPIILAISATILSYFYKSGGKLRKHVIVLLLIVNLMTVYLTFYDKINKNFFIYSPPISDLKDILNHVKQLDNSNFFIGQSQFFTDDVPIIPSINNEQKIYNHNYGYLLKKNYSLNPDSYFAIYPKYFIYPKFSSPSGIFTYKEIYRGSQGSKLYKNSTYTAYADIYSGTALKLKNITKENHNIKFVKIRPDEVSVKVDSPNNRDTLLVMESFAPGWSAKIDLGTELKFIKNDFLNISLAQGEHLYTFTYNSKQFIIGSVISFISFIFWFTYISPRLRGKIVKRFRRFI